MGGGGHAAPKLPENASPELKAYFDTQPALFNVKPGTKKKMEYWEPSFYLFAGGMLLAALAYPFLPNTDITDWARDEAEERMAMRARGETVEYGVNYAGFRGAGAVYMHDRPGSLPRPVTPADLATDDE